MNQPNPAQQAADLATIADWIAAEMIEDDAADLAASEQPDAPISAHCHNDRHTVCKATECACGCHWLMPLATGQVDHVTRPDGRTWRRAD